MNEITLSNNLAQIEHEIRQEKEQMGKSVWEIGKRLKHVKENNLTHGQFMDWYQSLGFNKNFVSKAITVAENLSNFPTLGNIGTETLYLIATLPDEEKAEQLERIEQGDTPTVRELEEVKRQLKLSRAANESLKEKNERLAKQALKNSEVKTVEKVIEKEVIPDDYKATQELNKQLLDKNKDLADELDSVKRTLRLKTASYEMLEKETSEAVALKESIEHLRADKEKLENSVTNILTLSNLVSEFEDFFDSKMAPLRFKTLIQGIGKDAQIEKLRDILTLTENWLEEMNKIIPESGRTIIEGEIINE